MLLIPSYKLLLYHYVLGRNIRKGSKDINEEMNAYRAFSETFKIISINVATVIT